MQTEEFTVQNVKCGGCASAIQQGLREFDNIQEVGVDIEKGNVVVKGENLSRNEISRKLTELGYPES